MPRGRRVGGNLSISQLEHILQSRRDELARLSKKRLVIERTLAQIDQQIGSLGGNGQVSQVSVARKTRRSGKRVKNEMSLIATMEGLLTKSSKPMAVGDIVQKVRESGYRSNSANFRGIVNQTLIKDKRFASAGRGLYQLKK